MHPALSFRKGFSLLEILTVVAVLGILGAMALQETGFIRQASAFQKLSSDTATVNQAARIYVANGGSLEGLTEPQDVLDKLKTSRSAVSDAEYAGFSGSMLDKRLHARMKSDTDLGVWDQVATWNPSNLRFEIGQGDTGAVEFYLDDALATIDYGTEDRTNSTLAFNTGNGWVWKYDGEADALPRVVPTSLPMYDGAVDPGSASGSAGQPGHGNGEEDDDSTSSPWPAPRLSNLLPPKFDVPPGQYRRSELTAGISLTNPNPAASSWIRYSLNEGDFATYEGPISIDSETRVAAFVDGDPLLWYPSATVSRRYSVAPAIQLDAPEIFLSAPQFTVPGGEIVTVILTNPNDPDVSRLEVLVGDAEQWVSYHEPLQLSAADYSGTVTILAKAVATSVDYADSPIATDSVLPALTPEEVEEARQIVQVQFNLLSSEAGYLNAATLFTGGNSYDFGNSDMGAGFSFLVDVEVNPLVTNRFDVVINTWKRYGEWIKGLDTRDDTGFQFIEPDDSFQGASEYVTKIKDLSTDDQIHLMIGFEDLIMTGDTPDWDYNDFLFEIRADNTFNFNFGGYTPIEVNSGNGSSTDSGAIEPAPEEPSDPASAPVNVASPNNYAISNVIFYFREAGTNRILRNKWDSVSGEVMELRFDFAGSTYADHEVIGYSVKAGSNSGGPNGEGTYVPVSGPRPSKWAQYSSKSYSSGLSQGIITVVRRK